MALDGASTNPRGGRPSVTGEPALSGSPRLRATRRWPYWNWRTSLPPRSERSAPLPEALERSILREPTRGLRALERQVAGDRERGRQRRGIAGRAVRDRRGCRAAARLRASADRQGRSGAGLATQLIRRVSPTVRVHDLGLTSYEDRGRDVVALTETRRKPAALLLYLVTRPDLAATREQVMEASGPTRARSRPCNSLHQTLFFLRRDIEPWYEDGSTADYIHMDAELVSTRSRSSSKSTAWPSRDRQQTSSRQARRRLGVRRCSLCTEGTSRRSSSTRSGRRNGGPTSTRPTCDLAHATARHSAREAATAKSSRY